MSVLWVVPLIVFAAGAVLVSAQLRKSSVEMDALRDECARFGEVSDALGALREETGTAQAAVRAIRTRGSRRPADR